ncbi:DUF4123 domain-containing protein [Pseudomonas sp. S2_C03]
MTSSISDTWLEQLKSSCAEASITCLDIIIDQAGGAPMLSSVLSVEPALPWQSLFTGLPEASAEDLAPLLVRVDLAQPLQRQWLKGLIQFLNNRSQLLVLASCWPFEVLAENLGQCLEARHAGRLGLLRYYDPRIFPLLFSHVLQVDQQQVLLRPALFWSWLDIDGEPRWLMGNPDRPPSPHNFTHIELSDVQLQAFACICDALQATEDLHEALPSDWSAQQRFDACCLALFEALQNGLSLTSERDSYLLGRLLGAGVSSSSDMRK